MSPVVRALVWVAVAAAGAVSLAGVAVLRGEQVNSMWLVVAAVCTFAVAYRFYGKWIAARVLALNDQRATPAERLRNGLDYEPTNRWIVLGHHFAAIAGPGPLVGPTLAAQFGYLPGTLWIILGCALGGAVMDLVVLFCSMRRDGKSLGQMAREEIGKIGGYSALLATFLIMIILLAVIGLVVVNSLKGSPWGTFTLAMTIPIAIAMGLYLRYFRPGRVREVSIIGFFLLVAAIFGGEWVAQHPALAPLFTLSGIAITIALVIYGFAASALPVWLLLAPRDYLSTFVKIGVVGLLGLGICAVRPPLELSALTQFTDGNGPIFAGKIFPFCFITIGCGALSGFHCLIGSGTTPKLISRESDALRVGYGAMCIEGVVAVLALIAACSLQPGVYFAVNSPGGIVGTSPEAAAATITSWGYPVSAAEMQTLAADVGEETLFARTGGAPSLALGMARIFSQGLAFFGASGKSVLGFWYHFAIMFEALFILTVIDAGTRVGRFVLQDMLGQVWKPLGRTSWMPGVLITSAVVVLAWGFFLYQGVQDPLGGINSLWPLFGIANQLLGAIGLCVATTVLLKMHGAKFMWITGAPLAFILAVTFTAGMEKIFSPLPRLGFLARASQLQAQLANVTDAAQASQIRQLIFNERLDAFICGLFLLMVAAVVADSVRLWVSILSGRKTVKVTEAPFVLTRLRPDEV